MKANDFREHCKQVAHWVDWGKTCDQSMVGYIERRFPGVPVKCLPCGFPCGVVV
jgi:hypothetical protein